MATDRFDINVADGWVKVADEADADFLIENFTAAPVKIRFDVVTPISADAPHHTIKGREGLLRIGAGHVYAHANYDGSAVVVTTS